MRLLVGLFGVCALVAVLWFASATDSWCAEDRAACSAKASDG